MLQLNCRFNTNSDTVYNIKEINCTHLESNNKKNIIFNLTFKNNMFIFEGLPVNATGKVNITLNGKKYNMTFTNVDLNKTIARQRYFLMNIMSLLHIPVMITSLMQQPTQH